MEITLGHIYRWHATTEIYRWHATTEKYIAGMQLPLIVRNNNTHHYNTRQNHHLRGSRPKCKPVVNSFSNRSVQIWNAISSKLNIKVSLYKFKLYVKLFLLENELLITYYH